MHVRRGSLRLLTVAVLTAGLAAKSARLAGQDSAEHTPTPLGHALQVDSPGRGALSASVPAGRREHLHVFFVNGVDVLGTANLRGLCGYVQAQGYSHAYYSQMTQGHRIVRRVRQAHEEDPLARIVLVGFSAGTYVVRDVAHALSEDGIPIALLVYIGGDFLQNDPGCRPGNAARIVNITGHGFLLSGGDLFRGTELDGAVNLRLACRHMLLPSRWETIDLLMRELTAAADTPGASASQ